jgi:phosphoglycerol transferase MdoB-like AlkP superfamily enzyme
MRIVALLLGVILLTGCATSARIAKSAKENFWFATWDHFAFSTKANWQIFHYWKASATRQDAERAKQQGGWWGDEVPIED